jgi:hypothetical protein
MAVAILLLVLVPAALVLTSAGTTSGQSEKRLTASSLASSYLDEVQALQSPVAPGGDNAPFNSNTDNSIVYDGYLGACGGSSQCVTWPSTPTGTGTTFPTQNVNSITYTITAAGGWCQEVKPSGTTTAWIQPGAYAHPVQTTYQPAGQTTAQTVNVYGYWVAVKVSWGPGNNANSGYVVQYGLLQTGANWPSLLALQGGINPASTPMCPTVLT